VSGADVRCPECDEPVAAFESFCEACGADLGPPGAASPVVNARPFDDTSCPTCGAPGTDATDDGYCGQCGRRWSPEREHDEHLDGPVAAVTDRGIDHWRNEDAVGVAWLPIGGGAFALIVCDGVSASQEPQAVSQAAVEAALPVLIEGLASDDVELETMVVEAAAAAQKAASELPFDPAREVGPGACTFVAVVQRDDVLVAGSLGDSRAYWVSDEGAFQLGRDDSVAADLVASGRVSAKEAVTGPGGHAITKWLGVDAIDTTPRLTRVELPGPGLVLVCSDGLWNYAPEPEDIFDVVGEAGPLGDESALALARRLAEFAEAAGGADNITVAIGPYELDLPNPAQEEAT
jgi:serine/threonine protein phosphatase PrpC